MRIYAIVFVCMILISACKAPQREKDSLRSSKSDRLKESPGVSVTFTPQWSHQAQFAGYYVAQAKGFYRSFGIDVEIKMGGPDNPSALALKEGKTDFASLFLVSALRERNAGNNVINIAQISQRSALMLLAKKNRGINSLADLKGKKLGLWRSDFQELSQVLLKQNKLDVEIVPMDNSLSPFVVDAVDAINAMEYNEYHRLIQSGFDPEELWSFAFSNGDLNIPEDGLYVLEDFYHKNTRLCKDFAEASMQGWLYAINNPDEALDITMQVIRNAHLPANRPHQAWMLNKMKDIILAKSHNIGKLEKHDFDLANKILLEQGMISNKVDYQVFYPHE